MVMLQHEDEQVSVVARPDDGAKGIYGFRG